MKPLATFALCLTISAQVPAQAPATTPQFTDPANLRGERVRPRDGRELPIDQGALGLQQLLRKLNTRASILNIVAHPDDEDGGMLTLYARGRGARVTDLSLTRGEGGQNAMTGDFEDALGLLRTQELLANDRYTGVDQMFGTEVDFGFSKTKEEAFAKWTHDRVLYDAVRAIRLVRPLVITATFIGGVTDGHGQHQVSGQIAQEAFKAAADPNVFPDMLAEGILPWQALRVYARVPQGAITDKGLYDYATNQYVPATFTNYVTGEVTTTVPTADVVVHEGTTDPLLTPAAANPTDLPASLTTNHSPLDTPLSYVQFARIGLGLQKSQIGPGVRNAPSGAFDVPYHLYGSAVPSQTSQAPKARHITAQAEGLGSALPQTRRAESPTQTSPQTSEDPNFFTGIDTSLSGIVTPNTPKPIADELLNFSLSISSLSEHIDPNQVNAIAPQLADALTHADRVISHVDTSNLSALDKASILHELHIKRVQLNEALALALGLTLDATTSGADQAAGTGVVVLARLTTVSASTLTIQNEWLQNSESSPEPPSPLTAHEYQMQAAQAYNGTGTGTPDPPGHKNLPDLSSQHPVTRSLHAKPRDASILTRPFFFRGSIETPVYALHIPNLRNAASGPAAFIARAIVEYRGVSIQLACVVHDGPQPLRLVPAGSLSLSAHAQVLPNDQRSVLVKTFLYPIDKPSIAPKLTMPPGWKSHIAFSDVYAPGEMGFQLDAPAANSQATTITASARLSGHETITEGYRPIGYGDLPRTNYYTPATTRIVPVDLQLPTRHNIAYLPGTGDAVPEALASINLTPTILTVADLTPSNLAKFDTVILGVRTYSAHPDLHGAPTQALLDYARNGGNVVVQYQTPEFTAADAPYPLSLGSNEKVVDETAPVALLDPRTNSYPEASASGLIAGKDRGALAPGHALLTTPNRITPADFNNWIEERGHGFLSTWDPHYTALTETHDPGSPSEHVAPQLPQRGGLITTSLGRGRWTYVAFALYRQLPEAVPGAYRLFLNLLNP